MIQPIASHEPSQPPGGTSEWFATAGHFDAGDPSFLVAVSHCQVTARNEHTARMTAAVALGAEPGAIEVTRIDLDRYWSVVAEALPQFRIINKVRDAINQHQIETR